MTVALFGKKKKGISISPASCVWTSAVTAVQFLNQVAASDSFSEEELYQVWSTIYAAVVRCLETEEDEKSLVPYLRNEITNPRFTNVFDRALGDTGDVLFLSLDDDMEKRVAQISQDLAENVTNIVLVNYRNADVSQIGRLSIPIFSHHMGQYVTEPKPVHDLLIAALAGSFSTNVQDICQGVDLYDFESTKMRISKAQLIFSLAPMLFLLREYYEKRMK